MVAFQPKRSGSGWGPTDVRRRDDTDVITSCHLLSELRRENASKNVFDRPLRWIGPDGWHRHLEGRGCGCSLKRRRVQTGGCSQKGLAAPDTLSPSIFLERCWRNTVSTIPAPLVAWRLTSLTAGSDPAPVPHAAATPSPSEAPAIDGSQSPQDPPEASSN